MPKSTKFGRIAYTALQSKDHQRIKWLKTAKQP